MADIKNPVLVLSEIEKFKDEISCGYSVIEYNTDKFNEKTDELLLGLYHRLMEKEVGPEHTPIKNIGISIYIREVFEFFGLAIKESE